MAYQALTDISLQINAGEFIGIIGATGSGKTTLIQHFNGLLSPQEGELLVLGQNCHQPQVRKNLWRQVGLAFQYPDHQLFAETVEEEIAYGLKNLGLSAAEIHTRTMKAMATVLLDPKYLAESPLTLSGGLKRKVALASVLAMEPEILILDEPTAGIEPALKAQLLDQLKTVQDPANITIIMVTHSLAEVAQADRLLVLHQGKLVLDGPPRQIFAQQKMLAELGLAVPVAVEVLHKLRQKGVPVAVDVEDLPQAVDEIIKIYRRQLKGG